jgi:hypothetical protein
MKMAGRDCIAVVNIIYSGWIGARKRDEGEQSEGQVATAARKRCGNRWHPPLTIERHCARTTELEGLLDAAAFHYTAGNTSSR